MRTRKVVHNHKFRVRVDRQTSKEIKETIIIPQFPEFKGSHLRLQGTNDVDRDLVYGELSVFDSVGAIDHFAEMTVKRGSWEIKIRRTWLKDRVYPVFVDPTLSVASNDIHLYKDTGGGCLAGETQIAMRDGSYRQIKDIQIGDETSCGRVVAVMEAEGQPVFNYRGIDVTEDHPVKHDGEWMLVGDLNELPSAKDTVPRTFNIETENRRLEALSPEDGSRVEFSAYDAVVGDPQNSFNRAVARNLQAEDSDDHG